MRVLGLITALCFLGIVDQVHERVVTVEFVTGDGTIEYINIPNTMIPCKVREGDKLMFSKTDDIFKVKCSL